jgi:TolB-like protein/Tfp pilus assembly protein PilF
VGEPVPGIQPSEKAPPERLDSWKEIATYLGRDVTTVQRWEKREGMPVHRHLHDKRGSVYALTPELDVWLQSRKPSLEGLEELEPGQARASENAGEQALKPGVPRWIALAGTVVLAVFATVYLIARNRSDHVVRPQITSLAVLPLKNLSGDSSQEYFADGMTDELIGRLSGIRDLRVTSHTSVMRFKNPQVSVPEIAKTLGVDAIVEGSVMREGNRVRVTAQLIRGATDEHFWSETYDRQLSDVLSLQSEIAQVIAEKVKATVTGEEHERLVAARSVSPEVYESYSQGSYLLSRSDKRADIEQAITYFNDALNRDPKFAPAYVGLAKGYYELGSNFIGDRPDVQREKVMSAARKALELDPTLSDARLLLADSLQGQWQWTEAEAQYKAALELNPNDSGAHEGFASWLLCNGRTEEALEWARRARELDPLGVPGADIATMLTRARHYDEAIHELLVTLAAQPDDPVALWDLGIVFIDNNQAGDAIPVLEKALSLSNRSPGVTGDLIRAYARAGRRADALRLLAELQRRRKEGYVPARPFVDAYLGFGENDRVFEWLEQAYKEHSSILQYLKIDPDFDPLRSDPRFADLMRRVGLS